MTKILDPHCDFLLVGDSLGMVLYGMDSTLTVTLDMMINHGAAVVRASNHACIVVDMPFGSYQESQFIAYRNCARVMIETGCAAVKIEGGVEMEDVIHYKIPLGPLGVIANYLFVQKKLGSIFAFRRKKLIELFGNLK